MLFSDVNGGSMRQFSPTPLCSHKIVCEHQDLNPAVAGGEHGKETIFVS
jgi:hypothetical protein